MERWVRRYQAEGINGLAKGGGQGRRGRLSPSQLAHLQEDLQHKPAFFGYQGRWTGKLVASHLDRHYKIVLSLRQCQRLLRHLRP